MTAFLSHFYSRKHYTLMKSTLTIINDFFSERQRKPELSLKHSSPINTPSAGSSTEEKAQWRAKGEIKAKSQGLCDPRRRTGTADPGAGTAARVSQTHPQQAPSNGSSWKRILNKFKQGRNVAVSSPFQHYVYLYFPNDSFMQINA